MKNTLLLLLILAGPNANASSDYLECRKDYIQNCDSSWKIVELDDYFCLQLKFDQLAISCQALIVRRSKEACIRDVVMLCPGEESQARRRHDCLTSKMNQLSTECRQAVERQQNEDNAQTEICKEDYQTFCPASKKFGLNDCMYEHYGKDKLSSKCKKIISLRYPSILIEFPKVKP